MATGVSVQFGKGALFSGAQAYGGGVVSLVVPLPTTMDMTVPAPQYKVVWSFAQAAGALPVVSGPPTLAAAQFTLSFQIATAGAGTCYWHVDGVIP